MANPISPEQREEIQKALENATPGKWRMNVIMNEEEGYTQFIKCIRIVAPGSVVVTQMDWMNPREEDAHLIANAPKWLCHLLSSEQAWRAEAERLQSVCKQLIGEEVMFQEGRYETEMSKLQSASQLQSNVYRKLELRHRAKCEQLNQAVEVLKNVTKNLTKPTTKECECETCLNVKYIDDFLSSLSQGTEETQ